MDEKSGGKEISLILKTSYKIDERLGCQRECDQPPSMLFEELGWDREPGVSSEKHYRKFVASQLEHTKEMMSKESEFDCFTLKRGQTRGASSSMFGSSKTTADGEADTTAKMGLFKALITVTHKDTEIKDKMFLFSKLADIRNLLRQIYEKKYPKQDFPIPSGFFCEDSF